MPSTTVADATVSASLRCALRPSVGSPMSGRFHLGCQAAVWGCFVCQAWPGLHVHVGARCGVDARIAPPFMEATDASRLVCVIVVSYQEYSLAHTHARDGRGRVTCLTRFVILLSINKYDFRSRDHTQARIPDSRNRSMVLSHNGINISEGRPCHPTSIA